MSTLPDALVQCAGMLVLGSCEETSVEEFRRVMETNYQRADALEKAGETEEAYKIFKSLGRYGDAEERAKKLTGQ